MKLSISERYVLLDILPKEGSFVTLKQVKAIRDALAFTDDEVDKFELKETNLPGGQTTIRWNVAKEEAVEIPISEKGKKLAFDALTALDLAGKLTSREYSLYELFVETGEA